MTESFQKFLDQINSYDHIEKRYFAAGNTPFGFQSYFDDIFGGNALKHVYILKGGPGVGKSTLLKRTACAAVGMGYTVEYYHCSSSPTSLDGILLPDLGIAVIDGTAPHAVEPKLAGVRDIIVNLGECWNIGVLEKHADEITALTKSKAEQYQKAYHYLYAAEQIRKELELIDQKALLTEKLAASVRRTSEREFKNQGNGTKLIRVTNAYCGNGRVHFATFEKLAQKNYFISDARSIGSIYLSLLSAHAQARGQDMIISPSLSNPKEADGLYFPSLSLSITMQTPDSCEQAEKHGKEYKMINMNRFLDHEVLKKKKQTYKFGEKCISALEEGAMEAFHEAGEYHDELERYYALGTDYDKVTQMTEDFIDKIIR